MACELEEVIAQLLILISCAGEEGCLATDLVDAIRNIPIAHGVLSTEPLQWTVPGHSFASLGSARTMWKWLVERNDVSVGPQRKFNHLILDDILVLLSPSSRTPGNKKYDNPISAVQATLERKEKPYLDAEDIRICTSEDTMWEAITGHAVDYKRVPRSEWLLLLGIASSKSQGILQGDLGRLVDQDKRSVPKRTDSLHSKGYIAKRTTLIKGTKTSKLWLKSFAPPLPKDGELDENQATIRLSRQALVADLESVPWHTRWTGNDIDYTALATTIMAVTRGWGVLRLQDLKAKLGVVGMRWQMKVVSKVCRFLNAIDAIQYVAATLDGRIFKDCIRYKRDLNNRDWSVFLATGKRINGQTKTHNFLGQGFENVPHQFASQQANTLSLVISPPWSMDNPIPATIAMTVQNMEQRGLTNPDIYAITLGSTFTRYLSSMTTSISSPGIQPRHLRHLQMRSEHIRTGKIASYRYYIFQHQLSGSLDGDNPHIQPTTLTKRLIPIASLDSDYGFQSKFSLGLAEPAVSLADIGGIYQPTKRRQQGQFKKAITEQSLRLSISSIDHDSFKKKNRTYTNVQRPQDDSSFLVILKVRPEAWKLNIEQGLHHMATKHEGATGLRTSSYQNGLGNSVCPEQYDSNWGKNETAILPCVSYRGWGRGRGRSALPARAADTSISKPWRCRKCGGSWKNDVGLKYHLEKSRTPCNPSHIVPVYDSDSVDEKSSDYQSYLLLKQVESFSIPHKGDGGYNRQLSIDTVNTAVELHGWKITKTQLANSPFTDITSRTSVKHKPELMRASNVLLWSEATRPRAFFIPKDRLPTISISLRNVGIKTPTPPPKATLSFDGGVPEGTKIPYLVHQHALKELNMANKTSKNLAQGTNLSPAPSSQSTTLVQGGRGNEKHRRTDVDKTRVYSIINDLVVKGGGAFPGDRPLWQAIMVVWECRFPDRPMPTTEVLQSTLVDMVEDKTLAEHWHGFRATDGTFSKCKLITWPNIDACSARSLQLVDEIKQAHPHDFSPPWLILKDITQSLSAREAPRGRGRGHTRRRSLAAEIAVLDAPVYAAQIASKRVSEVGTHSPSRFKRRRRLTNDEEGIGLSPVEIRWAIDSQKNTVSSDVGEIDSDYSLLNIPANGAIRFLTPNTFLEDDPLDCENQPVDLFYASPAVDSSLRKNTNKLDRDRQGIAVVEPAIPIVGTDGRWPYLDVPYFEHAGTSFTLSGWVPNSTWFKWAAIAQLIDKRLPGKRADLWCYMTKHQERFADKLLCCLLLELSWTKFLAIAPVQSAGPHNIWIIFHTEQKDTTFLELPRVDWLLKDQLGLRSADLITQECENWEVSSSSEEEGGLRECANLRSVNTPSTTIEPRQVSQRLKNKRVALATRNLTAVASTRIERRRDSQNTVTGENEMDNTDEVLAAVIAVRVILGGTDKDIDWGLLAMLFPTKDPETLQRFWVTVEKEQAPFVAKYTREFQCKLITAYECGELPLIDFDNLADYNWQGLIKWTMQIPHQNGLGIPSSKDLLDDCFTLYEPKYTGEDWGERFFHVQTSIFSRFEAVTSDPGAVGVDKFKEESISQKGVVTTLDTAKSWIKSLCCTKESKYSVQQVKEKFLTLPGTDHNGGYSLLHRAVDELAQERVISRSKKPPLGGRPYRLSEWYISSLLKFAQREKFEDAATFKTELDSTFRRQGFMKLPYTLNDGSIMALTNLNAMGRIRLIARNVPEVPFGFELGNYESRKYPKAYFHFYLEARPTKTYQHDENISILKAATRELPPSEGPRGELPQWADFFGRCDVNKWTDILGAFCFLLATRGALTTEGICVALRPTLETFEAQLIVDWGKNIGILRELVDGMGIAVREWWWLVVARRNFSNAY